MQNPLKNKKTRRLIIGCAALALAVIAFISNYISEKNISSVTDAMAKDEALIAGNDDSDALSIEDMARIKDKLIPSSDLTYKDLEGDIAVVTRAVSAFPEVTCSCEVQSYYGNCQLVCAVTVPDLADVQSINEALMRLFKDSDLPFYRVFVEYRYDNALHSAYCFYLGKEPAVYLTYVTSLGEMSEQAPDRMADKLFSSFADDLAEFIPDVKCKIDIKATDGYTVLTLRTNTSSTNRLDVFDFAYNYLYGENVILILEDGGVLQAHANLNLADSFFEEYYPREELRCFYCLNYYLISNCLKADTLLTARNLLG